MTWFHIESCPEQDGDDLVMYRSVFFGFLIVTTQVFACSSQSSSSENGSNSTRSPKNGRASQPETSSSPERVDTVLAVGKDYVRQRGWKIPASDDTYLVKREVDLGTSEDGKEIKVNTTFFSYKTPRSYTENFSFAGPDLDRVSGELSFQGFREYRVNAKVFMYAIFAEKVVPPAASNSDPHMDPFVYQIMDSDGDGVFETFRGEYDKIVVPSWVLNDHP